ncbi:Flp pilus assembly protein CpaB [Desulfurivibrio sp. C05AmB]|uniref:Flp pilus assembly protein CpaB n=1 Tax=Desulfurivibrio sp. C05AmB TaxID=3374371 RepID=UPI00376F1E4F
MQSRALLILLVAIILGGVAVYLVQSVLRVEPEERVVERAPEMAQVVVAATDLEVGDRLQPLMLTTAPFPAAAVPEGAYSQVATVIGDEEPAPTVIQQMRKGEVVLPHKISPPGGRAGLTVRIPDDMRAITISTDVIQGVAGFVLPGDRVDVLHTTTAARLAGDLVTRVLLQNIKVLAVDQVSSESEEEPKVVRAITLLVTPQQAQRVTLAQRVGQVTLALRSDSDQEEFSPDVMRLVDLQNIGAEAPTPAPRAAAVRRPAAPARPAAPTRLNVEVIRGLDVQREDVNIEQPDQPGAGGQQ